MTGRHLGPDGLMHPTYLEALREMPKDDLGHVVDLKYLKPAHQDAAEAAWREWCRKWPRTYWPEFLSTWGATKRHKAKREASQREGEL